MLGKYFCFISQYFFLNRIINCLFYAGGSTSKVTSAGVSVLFLASQIFFNHIYLFWIAHCKLGRVYHPECNAAIHKRCIEKIIGRCTGTATNSRETLVSKVLQRQRQNSSYIWYFTVFTSIIVPSCGLLLFFPFLLLMSDENISNTFHKIKVGFDV